MIASIRQAKRATGHLSSAFDLELESVDLPDGVALEEVRVDPAVRPQPVDLPELGPAIVALDLPAWRRRSATAGWPYRAAGGDDPADAGDGAGETAITVRAVPYFAWANRAVDAMRVCIPLGSKDRDPRQ